MSPKRSERALARGDSCRWLHEIDGPGSTAEPGPFCVCEAAGETVLLVPVSQKRMAFQYQMTALGTWRDAEMSI